MGKKDGFHTPFADLARTLKARAPEPAAAPVAQTKPAPKPRTKAHDEPTDEPTFAELMGEAPRRPRDPRGHAERTAADAARSAEREREDVDALASLASLVDGGPTLVAGDDDDVLEGWVEGLDKKVLRGLRRGDQRPEATLDLHGLRQEPAREAVERFIGDARGRGARAVCIVHGRGHNSAGGHPVLKTALRGWLLGGKPARHILAFCPAAPHDGGAGAVYVLLRR